MKIILLFCVSIFIVEAAFAKDKVCEPGTHWNEDCNSCFCSKDGTGKACTRMECFPAPRNMNTMKTDMQEKTCEPNSQFKDKCNTCWCSNDGTIAACTLMACVDPPKSGHY